MLRGQDIVVALKLALSTQRPTFAALGHALGLSASQAHAAVKRLHDAGLISVPSLQPSRQALLEFLVHGVKYVFPPERGPETRGMATAHGAPPLNQNMLAHAAGPVWPDPNGKVRGEALAPIHPSAVQAAKACPQVYQALALLDAIRAGRARERTLAASALQALLSDPTDESPDASRN